MTQQQLNKLRAAARQRLVRVETSNSTVYAVKCCGYANPLVVVYDHWNTQFRTAIFAKHLKHSLDMAASIMARCAAVGHA